VLHPAKVDAGAIERSLRYLMPGPGINSSNTLFIRQPEVRTPAPETKYNIIIYIYIAGLPC